MEENKTGVWIRCVNGRELRYNPGNGMSPFNVGDIVEVDNDDVYVKFNIKTVELKGDLPLTATYMIKPQVRINRTGVTRFHDAESIEMNVNKYGEALIIVPYWYKKEQYRNQNIRSTETAITVTRKEATETANEDLEIKTCTIPADDIRLAVLTPPASGKIGPVPSFYQQKPITATSEVDRKWFGGFTGEGKSRMMYDDRGLRSEIPTFDDLSGEMSATLTFPPEKIDEIMNKLVENEEEKEMYTDKLKNKIKKVIYVDKEMTVKEPVLDGNGKQLEEDGKPVTKDKLYRGMVKVVWNCGTETVAYTSMYDRFNKEEGFKTCVLKYLFGNADAHYAVDFWTNKYVKYPSTCIEVTENLWKLKEILENDKQREEERKGLPYAKFLRRTTVDCIAEFSSDKLHYTPNDSKFANEFKKLAKKYFPELKGKEIYVNNNKYNEVFVAIK